jgi:hypothetical protein
MTKPKFLYGAAVQGIQSFIFQTNTLQEIAGASELVEQICTQKFAEAIGSNEHELEIDPNAIVTAAGNIKYVFNDEEQCKKLVRKFPMEVTKFAPGITISQAVVRVDGEIDKNHIIKLEHRLRTQRNKPMRPYDVGLMAMNRSRKTGLPAVKMEENVYLDKGTILKNKAVENETLKTNGPKKYSRLLKVLLGKTFVGETTLDFAKITKTENDNYSWLAVVHSDGNDMGKALQKIGDVTEHLKGQSFIDVFREFSQSLDLATKNAANKAYKSVKSNLLKSSDVIPFRPIVIGGDDLTLVCRGDLAIEFTKHFLSEFNKETGDRFKKLSIKIDFLQNGLTACAGIAYIKESYPFHYGYQLAETLCEEAKKDAKDGLKPNELTPSCLMFHKVQDSFIDDFKKIRERELSAGKGENKIRFDFGPYYTDKPNKPTIQKLIENVSLLDDKEGNVIKSHLRQWLTDLHNEPGLAKQKLNRLISVASKSTKAKLDELGLPNSVNQNGKSPVYDWLTIHSINLGGKKL